MEKLRFFQIFEAFSKSLKLSHHQECQKNNGILWQKNK